MCDLSTTRQTLWVLLRLLPDSGPCCSNLVGRPVCPCPTAISPWGWVDPPPTPHSSRNPIWLPSPASLGTLFLKSQGRIKQPQVRSYQKFPWTPAAEAPSGLLHLQPAQPCTCSAQGPQGPPLNLNWFGSIVSTCRGSLNCRFPGPQLYELKPGNHFFQKPAS